MRYNNKLTAFSSRINTGSSDFSELSCQQQHHYFIHIYMYIYKLFCIRTSLAPFIFLFAWIKDSAVRARQECSDGATWRYYGTLRAFYTTLWTIFLCAIHIPAIIVVCTFSSWTHTASTCTATAQTRVTCRRKQARTLPRHSIVCADESTENRWTQTKRDREKMGVRSDYEVWAKDGIWPERENVFASTSQH